MFTATERQDVANRIIAVAEATDGITAGAVVGAAAAGTLNAHTGIDLLFAAAAGADPVEVRELWTRRMYREFSAIHHVTEEGAEIYLLADLLTARITIVPGVLFGPRPNEPFQQIFGPVGPPAAGLSSRPDPVGPAWLAALHAREALLRGDGPGAARALDGLRSALLDLASARNGAPSGSVPNEDRDRIRATEVGSSDLARVTRAFSVAVQILDGELQAVAPVIADAVTLPLLEELAG